MVGGVYLPSLMPSKKIMWIVASAFFVLGFWYFILPVDKPTIDPADLKAQKAEIAAGKKDSDNDGVEDWMEILEGTDPENPKDKKAAGEARITSFVGRDDKAPTVTNQLIQQYANVVKSQIGADNTFDQDTFRVSDESRRDIISNLLEETRSSNNDQKTYVHADITVDNSKTVKMYFTELGAVYEKYFVYRSAIRSESDLEVFKKLLEDFKKQSVSDDDVARVLLLRGRYLNSLAETKKIAVPQEVIDIHLAILNNTARAVIGLAEIAKIKKDPLLALVGINRYVDAGIALQQNDKKVLRLLKKHSVVFQPGELGYIVQAFAESPI